MDRKQLPNGDGHPVVLFPGLGTDPRYMAPLKDHCAALGYVCYDWGRGFNTGPKGDVRQWLADLASEVSTLVSGHQQTASLIGWSLGGLYAREIAKILRTRIRQVITLGSPSSGIADATHAAWLYRLTNVRQGPARQAFARTLESPPPVPTSSIYSRTDGVVAWRSCRIASGRRTENIEVESSHLGLVCNPHVLTVVADRLAQRAGRWDAWSDTSRRLATQTASA